MQRTITAQVTDVNKALLSVAKVLKAGHTVVLDQDGSFIEDRRTGERMLSRESGGMYMLKVWVNNTNAGF